MPTTSKQGNGKKKNTTKKSTSSAAKTQPKKSSGVSVVPVVLLIIGVFIGVCIIIGGGTISEKIRQIFKGCFGGAAYVLPILMFLRALLWKKDDESGRLFTVTICTAVAFITLTLILHNLAGGMNTDNYKLNFSLHYINGAKGLGGGVLGGHIGNVLNKALGRTCTLIFSFAATIILGIYAFGLSIRGVFVWIAYNIMKISEKISERRSEQAQKREAYSQKDEHAKTSRREQELREYRTKKSEQRVRPAAAASNPQNTADDTAAEYQMRIDEMPVEVPEKPAKRRKIDVNIPVDDAVEDNDGSQYQQEPEISDTAEFDLPFIENDNTADDTGTEGPASGTASEEDYSEYEPDDDVYSQVSDTSVIDEKIFEDVMKRTREREEKSGKADKVLLGKAGVPSSKQNNILPEEPDDIPSVSSLPDDLFGDEVSDDIAEADRITSVQDDYDDSDYLASLIDAVTEAEAGKELSLSDNPGEDKNVDISSLFVNPEDAELLERLSEEYGTTRQDEPDKPEVLRENEGEKENAVKSKHDFENYVFPSPELLTKDTSVANEHTKEELQENALKLVETLKSFKVITKIENISRGPTITRYELKPEQGVKVRQITNLVDDIALNLATTGVRIVAPIPGKAAVGIEVPNKNRSTVHLRSLIENDRFVSAKSRLTVCLGEDVAGEAVYFDISKMPHLLIAGATGSGKSVCLNSILTSMLYKASPDDVKLILIDPKKVELTLYNGLPHLLVPVVTEPKKAAGSLSWAVGEMERRYGLIEEVKVHNIDGYNDVTKDDPDYEYMPRIVIVIDELADLMMTAPDDVEESICRIAQKARAAGIHLIIGTQRPDVSVITGLIKANIPSRIAFRTSSQIDSRTIIDIGAASNLIGMGDMLFSPVGAMEPIRVQGAFVSDTDVEGVVEDIKSRNETETDSFVTEKIVNEIEREAQKCGIQSKRGSSQSSSDGEGDEFEDEDPLLMQAIELSVESGKISTSMMQRRLKLGYGRAAKIIDRMEELGYVSAPDGNKPRECLITKQQFMEMRLRDEI